MKSYSSSPLLSRTLNTSGFATLGITSVKTDMEKHIIEKSGWQLSEDGPEAYERYIVPAFSGVWAKDLVDRAALKNGESVLDIACGTGIVARYAHLVLGESGQITGVDVNEIVLEKARKIGWQGANAIQWKQGDVSDLPFSDSTFDVALCQQGLQYFPDRSGALDEIHRVLADKGRIVFSVWRPIDYSPFYCALHKALERYLNAAAAATLASAYSLGDSKQLRILFKNAKFNNIELCLIIKQMRYFSLKEFLSGGLAASPYSHDVLALEELKRAEMFAAIKNAVSDYIDDHGLAAPMECWVVSATK